MDKVTHLAQLSTIRNIRQRNLGGERPQVTVIWGDSLSVLPTIADDSFDLIYIDGSHYYDAVLNDIRQAKRLCKSGGIICGDDLEKLPSNELVNLASKNIDRDFIDGFHPGVLLAISKEFKNVNMKHGFWWVTNL